jgi:hypothetical protein
MAFGRRDSSDGPGEPTPDATATISGGSSMPQAAAARIQRLQLLEEQDKNAFTSDLSVNE